MDAETLLSHLGEEIILSLRSKPTMSAFPHWGLWRLFENLILKPLLTATRWSICSINFQW